MGPIRVFGDHDADTVTQLERCVAVEDDARGVLCADGHLGYSMPIGGVVAYREHVSPSGVGFDISCGNKAVRTTLRHEEIAPDLPRIMDRIFSEVSFGIGRSDGRAADHPVIDEIRHAPFAPQRKLADLAARQLGTVGAGNHYVDLFRDEEDRVWVGVHFGSRGFGHKTASGFLAIAQGKAFEARSTDAGMMSDPVVFRADSAEGQAYVEAMALAGRYAYAGRDVVVDQVCAILGAEYDLEVHNNHNYAWREEHGGETFWVTRKGATPAFPGQLGFVGATMGEPAVILEGVESGESEEALFSTVHGAGRAMSRTQAAGRWRHGKMVKAPAIDFNDVQRELTEKGIELRGGAADEAPLAYKRLPDVLAHHAGTVRVLHELRPIGVAMAPARTFDPFRD
jgi:tRNA-splicing ligase RtcB (3'-phosphate/5'-hydroxy nucleic acid ligase)